jgi:hypothetical protein
MVGAPGFRNVLNGDASDARAGRLFARRRKGITRNARPCHLLKQFINQESEMTKSLKRGISSAALAVPLLILSAPASAEYIFQIVKPPAASAANGFGISENGKAVGNSEDGAYLYDRKKDTYTPIGADFGAIDISNSGVIVGSVDTDCAIRSKSGDITLFTPPTATPLVQCQLRGVNANGLVTGFIVDELGTWSGFTYDQESGAYEAFLPSLQTFAHGINEQGQVVGSVALFPDEAYPGSVFGRFGFLRQPDGAVSYFEVTQSFPGYTRGRGISESGLVTGFYLDGESVFNGRPISKSYVTTLAGGPEFESITLGEEQIVYQSPCDASLTAPGPDYELFTDVFASHITENGVVMGSCSDFYFNGITGDVVMYSSGFIATPVQ